MLIFLIILLCVAFGCQNQVEKGISKEEAKAITDQILRLWNQGDLTLAESLYAPDYVRHHPVPYANANLDDFKNTVIANRTAFPDYKLMFDEIITKGDRIIVFATVTGTNTAPLEERPATGRKIRLSGIYVYLIDDGTIAEEWTYFNLLSYYQQLGFTLTPPGLQ